MALIVPGAETRSREVRVCLALNRWGGRPRVTRFFAAISRLGDGVFWYALMLLLPLADGWRGAFVGANLALTGIVALALYRTLKRRTRRPRPFAAHGAIVPHVAPLDEFSFPSGHTLHAVSFSLVACAWYPILALLLVPFAVLVAISRVVLGLHYPSDVLAATVIGSGLAVLSLLAFESLPLAAQLGWF
jgi:undecaprenyl-diphosphatase